MRLITCADSCYFDYLMVLLKSNARHDKFPVTVYDWGLTYAQRVAARHVQDVGVISLEYPKNERMLAKVRAIRAALDQYGRSILYLDADFMFRAPIRSAIDLVVADGAEVIVTPMDFPTDPARPHWLNAGFFFVKHSPNGIRFVDEWMMLSTNKADWWGDQESLRKLTKRYHPDGNSPLAKIGYLPCSMFNAIPSTPRDKLLRAKLVHMKGEHWHNVLTGRVEFPTRHRPEWMRPLMEEWQEIRES